MFYYNKYLLDGFRVAASVGHIRDLSPKELSVDVKNDFKPIYKNMLGKGIVIKRLKDMVSKSSMIYLATDMDFEGEAISWHLKEVLRIPESKIIRVTFNQITKKAIQDALTKAESENTQIDMNKVSTNKLDVF